MAKVAVVVLNYMNYQETIACVDSVLNQNYQDLSVIVVDNGSQNESFKVLRREYCKNDIVSVIRARKNYGFAKGNNIGIKYARERFDAEFVLVVNSDTILTDKEYILKMVASCSAGVGVIGSRIILRNGDEQRRYKEVVTFPETLFFYISLLNHFWGSTYVEKKCREYLSKHPRVEILHGCAFMLTPEFFLHYSGVYSKTFLYSEEVLLYILCRRANLKQIYVNDTSIYHKEDQSSKFLFNNENSKKYKYCRDSYKYVVKESFVDFCKMKKKKSEDK